MPSAEFLIVQVTLETIVYLFHSSILLLLFLKRKTAFKGPFYGIFCIVLMADLATFIQVSFKTWWYHSSRYSMVESGGASAVPTPESVSKRWSWLRISEYANFRAKNCWFSGNGFWNQLKLPPIFEAFKKPRGIHVFFKYTFMNPKHSKTFSKNMSIN